MIWMFSALAIPMGSGELPVGQTVHSVHTTELSLPLDIVLRGARLTRAIERQHRQVSELRRLDQGFWVSWTENHHQATEPGHAHDRHLVVEGKAYRVHGGVWREDGSNAAAEEAQIVGQVDTLELLPALRAQLGAQPSVGRVMPAGPMFAGILADAPGEARVEAGSLVLTEVRPCGARSCGVVRVTLTLIAEGEDARGAQVVTRLEAEGTAVLEMLTGWTTRFELAGSVQVAATRSDLQTTGTGTFSTRTVLRYPR